MNIEGAHVGDLVSSFNERTSKMISTGSEELWECLMYFLKKDIWNYFVELETNCLMTSKTIKP